MYIGDLNYDFLDEKKCAPLVSVCDIFSSEKFLKLLYVLKLFLARFILPFICTEIKLWTSLIPQLKFKTFIQLRSAVYKKRMTHNKFLKDKSNKNWEAYRKQRNLVTKLKKQSIRTYFYERCVGGPKSTDFYPTIKIIYKIFFRKVFKTPVCLKALFSRIYITLYLHRN
jgi:hypothetical protein